MTTTARRSVSLAICVFTSGALGACSPSTGAPPDDANGATGVVELALRAIPGDVRCVVVNVAGSSTVARPLDVTPVSAAAAEAE